MANNCSIFYDNRTARVPRFAPPYNLWSFHRPYHLRAPPPDFSLHTEAHRKPPTRSPAQRIRFGSGGARKRADNVFIKKRQPRIHRRANQRSVCTVKARSSRMSARRVLKNLVASPQTEAQRSGFGLDKEERRNEGEMAFALKKKTPSRTICSTRRRGGGGWIRTTEAKRNRFTVCPLWPLGNTPILS